VAESTLPIAGAPVTGTRFDVLRQQLLQRRLHALGAVQRLSAIAMMCSTVLAMTLVALVVFGRNLIGPIPVDPNLIGPGPSETPHAVGGVVVFVGLLLALTVLAGTLDVAPTVGWAGRPIAAVDRLLPSVGLVVLTFSVLLLGPAYLGAQMRTGAVLPALALWLVLAIACVYVSRRVERDTAGLFDEHRTAKAAVPAVLILSIALGAIVIGRSSAVVTSLLTPTLLLAAFASIAVLPAVSAESAVKGLDAVRNRGERAVRFARRRPRLVAATAVFKLLVIVAVWAVYHLRRPTDVPLGSAPSAWVLASATAAFVMLLFVLDRRFGLAAADHPVVSRASGLLLGGSLGGLIAVSLVIGTLGVVIRQPLPLVGVAVLLALGAATGGIRDRKARLATYAVAAVLAILAAIFVTRAPGAGGSAFPPTVLNFALVGSLLAVGLAIGIVCMLVRIRRTRRFTWLVYVAAVVIWMVIWLMLKPWLAPQMTMLNIDLVLTLFMILAAVLLAFGVQREIDAFEITVTLAATFILIELPLITALLPYPETLKLSIAAVAVLSPGLAALWAGTRMLAQPSEQRAGMSRLALSSLLYYLLLALQWAVGIDVTALMKGLEGVALNLLTVPLVLLLVAAGESGARITPSSSRDGETAVAGDHVGPDKTSATAAHASVQPVGSTVAQNACATANGIDSPVPVIRRAGRETP